MIAVDVAGALLLMMLNILVAIHMIFLRRVHHEELSLIRRQSAAITWLTEYAKADLEAQAQQTRKTITDVVTQQVGEVKEKLDQSVRTSNGGGS